jgi:hypothetical protein
MGIAVPIFIGLKADKFLISSGIHRFSLLFEVQEMNQVLLMGTYFLDKDKDELFRS